VNISLATAKKIEGLQFNLNLRRGPEFVGQRPGLVVVCFLPLFFFYLAANQNALTVSIGPKLTYCGGMEIRQSHQQTLWMQRMVIRNKSDCGFCTSIFFLIHDISLTVAKNSSTLKKKLNDVAEV
jgi:hypothetical protein